MDDIRLLNDEKEYKRLSQICTNAYPLLGSSATGEETLIKRKREDSSTDFYGLYRNEKLCGSMLLHDFKMNMLGTTRVNMGGIGFVAVDFLHKKEKICKSMLEFFIDHNLSKGVNMTALYSFRPDFYKKMGFGFGSKKSTYKINPSCFPKSDSKKGVTFLIKEDKDELNACFNRVLEKSNGLIEKTELLLNKIFDDQSTRIVGVKDETGKVSGYMAFAFTKAIQDNYFLEDMAIYELIYEDSCTLNKLFGFINSQSDQINRVKIITDDEFFHFNFGDPRNDTKNFEMLIHETETSGVGIMYRVIDVKGIFKELQNHRFNNVTDKKIIVELEICDSFLPQNQGITRLKFHRDGFVSVLEKELNDENVDVKISMDISDFSSMLMGSVDFRTLIKFGLATISDESYTPGVNNLFRAESKPICTTLF